MADSLAQLVGNLIAFFAVFGGFLLIWWGSFVDDQRNMKERQRERERDLKSRRLAFQTLPPKEGKGASMSAAMDSIAPVIAGAPASPDQSSSL